MNLTEFDQNNLLNNRIVIDLLMDITKNDNSNAKFNFVYNAMNESDPEKIKELNYRIMATANELDVFHNNLKSIARTDYLQYMKNICIKNGFDKKLMDWTWADDRI